MKQRWWVGDSFMILMEIIRAYLHEYAWCFNDFVYGAINIVPECGSAV